LDIDIGEGQQDRISLFRDDDPEKVAKDFCDKHEFDEDTLKVL